jgi:hypothetical protein
MVAMGCGNLVVEPNTGACDHLETRPDWDVWEIEDSLERRRIDPIIQGLTVY